MITTIQNVTISHGSAIYGGGINNVGTLTLSNSTISGNSATLGGGIATVGILTVSNSTISGNSAYDGGGIWNVATVNARSTIVANSPSGRDCAHYYPGIFTAAGTNLDTDGTCALLDPAFTQVLPAQLNLGPLALNPPGTAATHALLLGSVAVDAASDCLDYSANPVATDQRGVPRPQGPVCDIGAYEYNIDTSLTIVLSGSGNGTVSSTPSGIGCPTDCSETDAFGTVVALSATAASGSLFAGWTGDADCVDGTVRLDADRSCTATFNLLSDLRVTVVSSLPFVVVAGTSVSISDGVLNQGAGASTPSTTRYFLSLDRTLSDGDTELVGGRAVPALPPGQLAAGAATVTIPSTTPPGNYHLIACGDGDHLVPESDESNNCSASARRSRVVAPD